MICDQVNLKVPDDLRHFDVGTFQGRKFIYVGYGRFAVEGIEGFHDVSLLSGRLSNAPLVHHFVHYSGYNRKCIFCEKYEKDVMAEKLDCVTVTIRWLYADRFRGPIGAKSGIKKN